MAATAQRTAKRVLLGHELTYLRNRLGTSQSEVGKAISKGQGKIALLETGEATVTDEQLARLMDKLEVREADHREAIVELHKGSGRRGEWTTGFARAYAQDMRLLIDLERHTDQIFTYGTETVPGLLQAPSYVRTLSSRTKLGRGLTADDVVLAWKARQDFLTKAEGAPRAHFVLSESCLRRKRANSQIMHEQMEHLLEVSHLPNVLLQVLTFDDTENDLVYTGHAFTLLRVPTAGLAGPLHIAYNEGVNEIYYRDEPRAVDAHDEAKSSLTAAALNPEDTRQFITYISGNYLTGTRIIT
jgi:transcriptional regulator with XRE-family HTH domain